MNETKGLIYKVQPYLENSKLIKVLTPLGKTTLNARGSQKISSKDRIITQYLTLINFEYNEFKDFMYLSQGKLLDDYKIIKDSFINTKHASLVLELIDKTIIDAEYNGKIFNLVLETLNSVNIEVASLSFALKLLYVLGYGLNLTPTSKKIVGVSIERGGLVYEGEGYYLNLNLDEAIILLKLINSQVSELDNYDVNELKVIRNFIYYYYEDKMDLKLKMLK